MYIQSPKKKSFSGEHCCSTHTGLASVVRPLTLLMLAAWFQAVRMVCAQSKVFLSDRAGQV